MNMWLLWSFWFVLTGISAVSSRDLELLDRRSDELPRAGYINVQGLPCLKLGPVTLSILQPVILGLLFILVALVNDLTYAMWVGSTLGFLSVLVILSIIALTIEFAFSSLLTGGEFLEGDWRETSGEGLARFKGYGLLIAILFYLGLLVYAGQMVGVILVLFILLIFGGMILGYIGSHEDGMEGEPDVGRTLVDLASHATGKTLGLRAVGIVAILIFLLLANLTPYSGDLDFNPTFASLNETADNTGEPTAILTQSQEVRVISWGLATEYLQRAYSDAASTLSTDALDLQLNTDPAYVNGRFVWVNAPRYEFLKWTGDKEVPFVVSVVNDPQNMSQEGFEAISKTATGFVVHKDRIGWGQRLDQLLHDRYAGTLVNIQVRITLDDDGQAWWVVYLGQRHVRYNVVTMDRILLVDANDMDHNFEYMVDDPDIPAWLEVVYPDNYIFDWAKRWGKWREGFLYRFFTKRHLSYPDDTPRFLILDGTPHWYVPMKQLDSKVLAGYILMNTRTGETIYYNREARSLAERATAHTQVERYLLSGIEGFRRLTIQEGYLYPIQMDTGSVREAYIFPLYSGFTIQQYAIIDAQYYTQEPVLSTDLDGALATYRSQDFTSDGNRTYDWQNWTLLNGYIDDTEAALTAFTAAEEGAEANATANATANSTTTVIFKKDLDGGVLKDGENEWRELRLALSEFDRTGNATLAVVIVGGRVVDIDYAGADLISH